MIKKVIFPPPPPPDADPREVIKWQRKVCEILNELNDRVTTLETP